jgi:hypothetical protein
MAESNIFRRYASGGKGSLSNRPRDIINPKDPGLRGYNSASQAGSVPDHLSITNSWHGVTTVVLLSWFDFSWGQISAPKTMKGRQYAENEKERVTCSGISISEEISWEDLHIEGCWLANRGRFRACRSSFQDPHSRRQKHRQIRREWMGILENGQRIDSTDNIAFTIGTEDDPVTLWQLTNWQDAGRAKTNPKWGNEQMGGMRA